MSPKAANPIGPCCKDTTAHRVLETRRTKTHVRRRYECTLHTWRWSTATPIGHTSVQQEPTAAAAPPKPQNRDIQEKNPLHQEKRQMRLLQQQLQLQEEPHDPPAEDPLAITPPLSPPKFVAPQPRALRLHFNTIGEFARDQKDQIVNRRR